MRRAKLAFFSQVAVYPQPIVREFVLQQVAVLAAFLVSGTLAVELVPFTPLVDIGLPIMSMLLVNVVFIRDWRAWALIDHVRRSNKANPIGQEPRPQVVTEALTAVVRRKPSEIRQHLDGFQSQNSRFMMYCAYSIGMADLIESKDPALSPLRDAVNNVTDNEATRHNGELLLAMLEAGSENLAGRDWRPPLNRCQAKVAAPLSPRRILFPTWSTVIGLTVVWVGVNLLFASLSF